MVKHKFTFSYCDLKFLAIRYTNKAGSSLELYQTNAEGLEVFISFSRTCGGLGTYAEEAERCMVAFVKAQEATKDYGICTVNGEPI